MRIILGIAAASVVAVSALVGAHSAQAETTCTPFRIMNHISCDSVSFYNSGVPDGKGGSINPVPSQPPAYSGNGGVRGGA